MRKETKESFWVFGLCMIFFSFLFFITDGPLMSPDSYTYRNFSVAPWEHLGEWPATGLPFWLYFFNFSHLPQSVFFILVAALRISLVFYFFRKFLSCRVALVASLPLLLGSQWLQLSLSYWTEVLFLCHLLGFTILLKSKIRFWEAVGVSLLLFVSAIEIRTPGIFFLPALVLALSLKYKTGVLDFLGKAIVSVLVFGGAWMISNVIRSGELLRPAKGKMECYFRLISVNELPLCQFLPQSSLCVLDPEKKFLSVPTDPGTLHFDKESPYVRLKSELGEDGVCEMWELAKKELFDHLRIPFFQLIGKRIWKQFSRWNYSEQGAPENPNKDGRILILLDKWNSHLNPYQQIYRGLLVMCFLGLVFFRILDPSFIFLFLGGLSHAIGIALTNPFLALRYQAIHKHCIYLAVIFVFWVLTQKFKSKRLQKS